MESVISEDDIARAADAPEAPPQPARETSPRLEPQRREPEQREDQGAQPEDPYAREKAGLISEAQKQRERRKEAEKALAARDREMAEMKGRFATFEQLFQRQAQPAQPQPTPETFDPFVDPKGFSRAEAASVVDERLSPIAQQQAQFQRTLDFNNRMLAGQVHGQDVVKAAEEAFNTASARGEIDPSEHRRINSSPNPYAAAVEWHKRNEILSKVGDDPDKWFDSTFEERLRSNPEFQRRAMEMLQGQAQAAEASASGRAQPVFAALPSVNGAAGASARGPSTITEDDIYGAAPQKMGRR